MTIKFSLKVSEDLLDMRSDFNKLIEKNPNFNEQGIKICDTTLRDGNQGFGINLSIDDKIKIARKLSDFGIRYLEGGWPSTTNRADLDFFNRIKKESIDAKFSAVGMTRRPGIKPEDEESLNSLIKCCCRLV